MPRATPFHPRTKDLCTSLAYKEWAGCHAVRRYDMYQDREYYALRNQATLMDATPLYKYDIQGSNAADLLSRVTVREFGTHSVGRVSYVCWCDDHGKVLDDGTVTRLDDRWFRLTSSEPALRWLRFNSRGLDVAVSDVSRRIAALALQGPLARAILRPIVGAELDDLRFFRAMPVQYDVGGTGAQGVVTRTGYTGDLGYELWMRNEDALDVYDAVVESGRPFGLLPMGLDALDVARVEAGFVLAGVDYTPANQAFIERQKSSPYELGFDWMVRLDRGPFIGQAALRREVEAGPARRFVGVEVDWDEFEALHERFGLIPHIETATSREGVPLYEKGRQIGYATSRTWSPLLKKYLALGTVEAAYAGEGTHLQIEVTCEYERHHVGAAVRPTPFFDPERKKA
ncbi:MAG: aminomethyltransferase family protein [Gemmatimonadota bacterium]|nr:aminomethyltransferase family protein [Gemmatimonadota bacterium]